ISLLLLFSVAIAIRLGAFTKSASAKGSNKALYIIIVNISLKYIKNKEKDSRPKFAFRLKGLPIFYIVLYLLTISIKQKA
ncbi:hypothetical protein V2W45_1199391, partial [Cenococcum geophilum]